MKGGRVPIHIMRWAPADYVNDPFVRLLVADEDFATLAFYHLVLNWSHMEGGDLPADPRQLAAVLGMTSMRRHRVLRMLQVCLDAGKLVVINGRLSHPRVVREVAAELAYRAEQAELGKKGGQIAGRGRPKNITGAPLIEDRGSPLESIGPPSPSPTPAPSFVERDGSSGPHGGPPTESLDPPLEPETPPDEAPPSNGNGQVDDSPERLDPGGFLDAVKVRLSGTVPTQLHATWIRPLEAGGWEGDVLLVEAPTADHRTWVRRNYADRLRDACRELGQDCRIRITVRPREPAVLHDGAL